MTRIINSSTMKFVSLSGFILCIAAGIWLWHTGMLTSQDQLETFISHYNAVTASLIFICLQIVQVVVPIIPGGIGCLAGVLLFGSEKGFFLNYIGICIGSVLAFVVARQYGRPLLYRLFSLSLIQRYDHWCENDSKFAKWFAFFIFIPVAPDDYLCFLAGTTKLSLKRFTLIILLCKPFSIALYSLGLTVVFKNLLTLIS